MGRESAVCIGVPAVGVGRGGAGEAAQGEQKQGLSARNRCCGGIAGGTFQLWGRGHGAQTVTEGGRMRKKHRETREARMERKHN